MNVLAVFAHPDDEVLGCGGTLAKHAEAGDRVFIQAMVDCGRFDDMARAGNVLGAACGPLGCVTRWKDQQLDREPLTDIIRLVESVSDSGHQDPDIIYTHHPGDLNLDHALTARAVLTAFRPKPGEKPRTILACEVLSSTEYTFPSEFDANWFVDIGADNLRKKIDAMRCYETEIHSAPHPRSAYGIDTLSRYRGNQCGVWYAEAFQLLRRGPC